MVYKVLNFVIYGRYKIARDYTENRDEDNQEWSWADDFEEREVMMVRRRKTHDCKDHECKMEEQNCISRSNDETVRGTVIQASDRV